MVDDYFRIDAPLEQAVRYTHTDCSKGKGAALIVTRYKDHWRYICHRCGWKGRKPIQNLTPAEAMDLYKSLEPEPQEGATIALPMDYSPALPDKALVWLMRYGITEEDRETHKIGYSRFYDRVILPVYESGILIYWQGRNLGKIDATRPKYLNIRDRSRKDTYFKVLKGGNRVVLVEDILSCIKVSHICSAIALLGTHIPDRLVLGLDEQIIYIWLDADKIGEALSYTKRFQSLGLDVRTVYTREDPKVYSDKQIKKELKL